jgi:putative DNA methylase
MSADVAAALASATALSPLSLKDTPSFIEVQFPVGRLSAEAYKERKAGSGQTLTALGSYWKGRKPLILCRAVVLGCLLPATSNPAKDFEIFLKLMGMDDAAFLRRGLVPRPSETVERLMPIAGIHSDDAAHLFVIKRRVLEGRKAVWIEERFDLGAFYNLVEDRSAYLDWNDCIGDAVRHEWRLRALDTYTYDEKIKRAKRPEECEDSLLDGIWPQVNAHLGTSATSLSELVEQLGIARFGHRQRVSDTFCGGGSIPFEAARIGCDVYASDLNPIACMLTWGAFNIIGADLETRAEFEEAQREVAAAVETEIMRLEIEHDEDGNRAKAYLYCLETRCPKTGWMVPMAPSWAISKTRNVVAKLVPNDAAERYEIEIHSGVSADKMKEAEQGTVRNGRLIHPMNPERSGVEISTIRGDYREGISRNRLRLWERSDFIPRPDDIWQERLYAIQWVTETSLSKGRQETFFASVSADDLSRERRVETIVRQNLTRWQDEGRVPDMSIEPGDETTRLFRERGWTHWHHLFTARQLLYHVLYRENGAGTAWLLSSFCKILDYGSRLCRWDGGHPGSSPQVMATFTNQALNPLANYGAKSVFHSRSYISESMPNVRLGRGVQKITVCPASEVSEEIDIFITDPPYADAINYHEITEFFIAWLQKNLPSPLDTWTWNSRRDLAIKGRDEDFRRAMVAAYSAMTRCMPDNGLQVVMFTHQDAGVWADLGAILWAAGLSVTAAWNVGTETESALKEGNYVQGTLCLVLRKRLRAANARRMEIEAEIEEAVHVQLDRLQALGVAWKGETLYTDGDLTMAAYAAALQVVTSYSNIDRQPLDRDLYRNLGKGERTMLRDLVDYAAQIANGLLVPEGFPRDAWRDLDAPSRFYVRMLDRRQRAAQRLPISRTSRRAFLFPATPT